MPVARNLQASPPSPLGEDEARRQGMKLVRWLFCGLIVLLALFSVLSWTVWEVYGLFAGVQWPRVVEEKQGEGRDLSNVSSDKVCEFAHKVRKGEYLGADPDCSPNGLHIYATAVP